MNEYGSVSDGGFGDFDKKSNNRIFYKHIRSHGKILMVIKLLIQILIDE